MFDLDGTLLDTEILWVPATADYLASIGCPVEPAWALQAVYGRSWTSVYADIVARFPRLSRFSVQEMADAMAPFFHRRRDAEDVRIPGSVALLRRLSRRAPCCIVSGSPREEIEEAIRIMDAADAVTLYLGAQDYAHGKPAPDCFLQAARALGVAPRDCVVFEDSAVGIAAARAAGMGAVALSRPDRPRQDVSAAHLILPDLSQFRLRELAAAIRRKGR